MTRVPSSVRYVLALVGPVALAVAGSFHPAHFTAATTARWHDLHVVMLPMFPLLTLTVWVIVSPAGSAVWRPRGTTPTLDAWLADLARLLSFGFGAFYTALDVLAGIANGALGEYVDATGDDVGRSVGVLFGQGGMLGEIGTWMLLAAFIVVGVVAFRRTGPLSLAGTAVALVASWSFMTNHVYWPRGVITMLAFGLAALLLLLADHRVGRGAGSTIEQRTATSAP